MPLWSLPNRLSLTRIFLIPLILILLCTMKRQLLFLSLVLFIMAGITDGLDGYVARRFKLKSTFGLYLDPLADKLLICSVLITLTYLRCVPLWMALLMVGRELVITSIRAFYAYEGLKMAPSGYGKLKTLFQIIGISATILGLSTVWFPRFFYSLGLFILCVALFLSLLSATLYLYPLFRSLTQATS